MGGDARVTLATVEDAALATASADAEAIRRAAQERAEAIIDQARAKAAALIAARRAAAERLADLEARERLAEARGEARATVLRAQRSVLLGAKSAAHAASRRLVDDSRYDRLLERLAVDARERLAAAGPVQIVRLPEGGQVARAGSREIDYSLGAQVDRCLDAMASELERLWQ
jgi:vacuolar-type H+-ATPase subunit E/Vma4